MRYSQVFQRRHRHLYRESYMQQHALQYSTSNRTEVALAASRGEDAVQVMFAGAQDSARTHARLHGRPADVCSTVVTTSVTSRRSQFSTCHGHVYVSTTEPSRLLRRRLGISCRQNSSNCDRQRHSDKNLTYITTHSQTPIFCIVSTV